MKLIFRTAIVTAAAVIGASLVHARECAGNSELTGIYAFAGNRLLFSSTAAGGTTTGTGLTGTGAGQTGGPAGTTTGTITGIGTTTGSTGSQTGGATTTGQTTTTSTSGLSSLFDTSTSTSASSSNTQFGVTAGAGSNTTLGRLLTSTAGTAPFGVIGLLQFDGGGRVYSRVSSTMPLTQSGTYTVNNDCTVNIQLSDVFPIAQVPPGTTTATGTTTTTGTTGTTTTGTTATGTGTTAATTPATGTFDGVISDRGDRVDLVQSGGSGAPRCSCGASSPMHARTPTSPVVTRLLPAGRACNPLLQPAEPPPAERQLAEPPAEPQLAEPQLAEPPPAELRLAEPPPLAEPPRAERRRAERLLVGPKPLLLLPTSPPSIWSEP